MKTRVADYIASYLAEHGVNQLFSVVGGGAMHLNNAFAREDRINVIYNHHEQASAIAAESYSRIHNEIAAVCVTSGPGGTNALTGVLCAWQDSLPMVVISGQVRYDITVRSTGLDLRQFGEQEYYIIDSVKPMTKYAVMVDDARFIKYHLTKALELATTGRRGPVWLDIPLNIQGQMIDTDELVDCDSVSGSVSDEKSALIIMNELQKAKRPVIIAGSGLRTSGALDEFTAWIRNKGIPVICPTSTVDYYTLDEEFFFGMFGTFGGRIGNFVVQNADLIVGFAARMSFKQIGFNYQGFSPDSKKIIIDADPAELKKPTVDIDIPICADVACVVSSLRRLDSQNKGGKNISEEKTVWFRYCEYLKNKFKDDDIPKRKGIMAKVFCEKFLNAADKDAIVVLGNNTAAVSMLQCGIRKNGQRMYGNVNCGTMGYDIPAAIGAATAVDHDVYCATGDGSMQMNIQELQTIVHNRFPVKIIVFNNHGYQAIVQTHTRFFGGFLAGCTSESGVSFPSLKKIADAYGFDYRVAESDNELDDAIGWLVSQNDRCILELIQSEEDIIIPKLSSKRLDDGGIISPPIDDLFPFLDEEDYKQSQFGYFCESEN